MTEDAIFDAVVAFLAAVDAEASVLAPGRLALERVIRSHQSAPRPAGRYAMVTALGFLDERTASHPERDAITVDAVERTVEAVTRSLVHKFRIDVFAPRAGDVVRLFMTALRSSRAETGLPGIALRRVDPAIHAPELVGSRWEGRAAFNVELAALDVEAVLIDDIAAGHVDLTGRGATQVDADIDYQRTNP